MELLETLDKARETAKRLEATQTAQRKTRKAMSVTTPDDPSTPEPVATVGRPHDGLALGSVGPKH